MTENKDKEIKGHNYSMINDAIHGVMILPKEDKKLIKSLIDSETFQRLRHIKQLGLAELIFPTAVHNRFSHCLGTAYIASRMSDKLGLIGSDKKYTMIGALLHDIGHGPFSHAFEGFLVNKNGKKVKHERWTKSFLREFEEALEASKLKYKTISRLIEKKEKVEGDSINYYLIRDIITSQVDADRLDYLLRDAHFCGVPYGNPDIDWIIEHATRIEETEKPPRLGFLKKGWHAVEHFLLCRRIMTQNICYHNKINFFENLFRYFLVSISEDDNLIDKISNSKLKKFIEAAGKYRQSSDSPERFIQENYHYYKTLADYDIWTIIRDFSVNGSGDVSKMARKIYGRQPHETFEFDSTCEGAVNSILEKWRKEKSISEWKAFIIKSDGKAYESQNDPVLIKEDKNHNKVQSIQKYSDLLKMIGDKSERKCYLALDESIPKKNLKENLKKYIPSLGE